MDGQTSKRTHVIRPQIESCPSARCLGRLQRSDCCPGSGSSCCDLDEVKNHCCKPAFLSSSAERRWHKGDSISNGINEAVLCRWDTIIQLSRLILFTPADLIQDSRHARIDIKLVSRAYDPLRVLWDEFFHGNDSATTATKHRRCTSANLIGCLIT